MTPGKVLIVGGSVGGLFIAVLLHRAGWQVALYERSAVGLAGKGAGLVAQMDVSRILAEIGREDVFLSGVVANERVFLDDVGNILQTVRRPQSQISWDSLFEAFRSELPESCYLRGASVVSANEDGETAHITMADGTNDTGDLIIGADGNFPNQQQKRRHAFGVDDTARWRIIRQEARLAARMMMLFQHPHSIRFLAWVTFIEQMWVSFRER